MSSGEKQRKGRISKTGNARVRSAVVSLARKLAGIPLEKHKQQLESALQGLKERIVIMIDDIDRLRGEEIRDIMKLVRLAADLPNTTYILSFDRERVEQALAGTEASGRAYLEKIVNVTFDIPVIRKSELAGALSQQLKKVLPASFDEKVDFHYKAVFRDVLLPLIRTPRDIKRYINALPLRLSIAAQEVAVPDICAMEAIRIFLPDLFKHLADHVELLTHAEAPPRAMVDDLGRVRNPWRDLAEKLILSQAEQKPPQGVLSLLLTPIAEQLVNAADRMFPKRVAQLREEGTVLLRELLSRDSVGKEYLQKLNQERGRFEALLACAGIDRKVVEKILVLLFPATERFVRSLPYAFGAYGESALRQWRKGRRIAHPDVLSFYLETLLPGGVVPHQQFLRTYRLLQEPKSLEKELDAYSSKDFGIFLDRLIDYSYEISHDSIEPLLQVLYRQLGRRLGDEDAMPGWNAESKLAELTRDLFSRFGEDEVRNQLATAILGKVERLSLRANFLRLVGRAGVGGHVLITEARERELSLSLFQDLEVWSGEGALGHEVLAVVELLSKDPVFGARCQQHFSNLPRFLLFLRHLKSDFASMRGVMPSLPWGQLETCFGKEFLSRQVAAALRSCSEGTMPGADANDLEVLRLASRYVDGYRDEDNNVCSH